MKNSNKTSQRFLEINEVETLTRNVNEKALILAIKDFKAKYPDKKKDIDNSTEEISQFLNISSQTLSSLKTKKVNENDNRNHDEHDFIPDEKDNVNALGEGFIPDFLGIAPIARTLQRPLIPFEREEIYSQASFNDIKFLSSGLNVDRMAYPWCCIGKVMVTASYELFGFSYTINKSGTGSMIGRNLMVTAAHVVPYGAKDWTIEFIPAQSTTYAPNQPFESAFVTTFRQHKKAKAVTGYDIAICKLDRPLGDLTGWFGYGYSNDDDFYYDASFFSAGYPGIYYNADEMLPEYNIKVRDIDSDSYNGKEIETDAFTNKGWSGGPLFSWINHHPFPIVVGVLSGREKDLLNPTHSVFAGGRRLVDLVNYGLNNWK